LGPEFPAPIPDCIRICDLIILDIDGVVADMFGELDLVLQQAGYPAHHWEKWQGYHWSEIYPDIDRDVLDLFLKNPLLAKNAKAFEDAWYWTNHYSSQYDIMYLTARDPALTQVTWNWFFEWDIPADFVVFEKNKPEFLSQIQVSVYVDDYPDMVRGSRDLGINAFLLNRPYNMNADIDPEFRINSLWDIKCV